MDKGKWWLGGSLVTTLLLATAVPGAEAALKPLLIRIQTVAKEGTGNVEVARAWRELVQFGPDALLPTLGALDHAKPTAANWLRSAVEAIVDRSLAASKKLPAGKLEAFVKDRRHAGAARRLAYECLLRVDKTAEQRLIPGMLDDPGAELRRDAVALVLQKADKAFTAKDKPGATGAYRMALAVARDRDQVELIAKRLKELGVPVDLTAHYGFITHWMLIGPFDNTGGAGFKAVFPPEKGVDLSTVLADPHRIIARRNRLILQELGPAPHGMGLNHQTLPEGRRHGCQSTRSRYTRLLCTEEGPLPNMWQDGTTQTNSLPRCADHRLQRNCRLAG